MVSTSIPTLSIAAISSAKAQTWQDRRRYLLSLAIGRSETAKITPFEKHVNKISVSEGSERKKSLTLGVFEWCPPLKSPKFPAISRSEKSPKFLKELPETLAQA